MRVFLKYTISLLTLDVIIFFLGSLILSKTGAVFMSGDFLLLLFFFNLITLTHLYIFFRGQTRDPGSSILYTLVSVSLKLLLEMVLALIWFIVIKKTSRASLYIFFVLYLTLAMFSLFVILKTLKNKSLKKEILF